MCGISGDNQLIGNSREGATAGSVCCECGTLIDECLPTHEIQVRPALAADEKDFLRRARLVEPDRGDYRRIVDGKFRRLRPATVWQPAAVRWGDQLAVTHPQVPRPTIACVPRAPDAMPLRRMLYGTASRPRSLADASVAISITLQSGVSARALAKSIARIPESIDGPATKPASPIGAALDLLVHY